MVSLPYFHEIRDLCVDMDVDKFIEAIQKYNANVLCMSALLTSTARYMETVKNMESVSRRGDS